MPRKLILRNFQSPGDIVMLTAVVRDLHELHPGAFLTDVRTPCPDLWIGNPWLTPLRDDDAGVEVVDCHYPLIHRSNQEPWHFLHGFHRHLGDRLDVELFPTRFAGDIHLLPEEREHFARVRDSRPAGEPPCWLFASGGKFDYTIKWWSPQRYRQVVEHFRGRIDFVQVGEDTHHHPAVEGVIDLRGQTTLRQLVRLMHHAEGAISAVSLLMHLAAAVEVQEGMPRNRPCVVVAGGREPPHWTAYPHHQFIHTVGALRCCDDGGCWRSRTVPLGDGDAKDAPDQLCVDVVDGLPRCMDLISADESPRTHPAEQTNTARLDVHVRALSARVQGWTSALSGRRTGTSPGQHARSRQSTFRRERSSGTIRPVSIPRRGRGRRGRQEVPWFARGRCPLWGSRCWRCCRPSATRNRDASKARWYVATAAASAASLSCSTSCRAPTSRGPMAASTSRACQRGPIR